MTYRNLVQPKNSVKFFHYLFVMIDDVVSCIIYMAGIKAHAEVFRIPHAVINRFKFFERTTNLAAFSCHCLQGNLHFHIPVSYTHLDVYKRQIPTFLRIVSGSLTRVACRTAGY